MKKYIVAALVFTLATLASAQNYRFPEPGGWVNDFAGIIPYEFESRIKSLAEEVEKKTGVEVTVVTVEHMDGMVVEEYANRLYEEWGIGKGGEDNGLLMLLAMEERKVRIEVGYGLEGILPDGRVGEILDRYALPDFRDGDYGSGLYRSLVAVAGVIANDMDVTITGTERARVTESSDEGGGKGFLFIIVFIFLMIVTRGRILPWLFLSLIAGGGGSGGGFGGGGFSGGSGGVGGRASGGGGASRGF